MDSGSESPAPAPSAVEDAAASTASAAAASASAAAAASASANTSPSPENNDMQVEPPAPPPLQDSGWPLRSATGEEASLSSAATDPAMATATAADAQLNPGMAATSNPGMFPRKRSLPDAVPEEAQKALKVEDALTYLDKVKTQFGDQPHIYNKFLDIMKNFKAETIDTPGVIRHVQALFRGHNNLILGFNTFLPPGCRIELSHLPPDGSELPRPNSGGSMSGGMMPPGDMVGGQPMMGAAPGYPPQAFFYGQAPPYMAHGYLAPGSLVMGGMAAQVPPGMGPVAAGVVGSVQAPMQPHEVGEEAQGPQPVEFDQAISYVTKIKRRFQHDPDTYKSFLEILHTYQKEQKSIKEVLDQVAELFRDHSDLLREFTYFLPDNVRDKAKQEIARISARRNKEEQRNKEKKVVERKPRPQTTTTAKREVDSGSGAGGMSSQRGATQSLRSSAVQASKAEVEEDVLYFEGHIPKLERRLFARIKSALASRERWAEFLKCLHLFSQEVINRAELVALASDIFVSHHELLEELDRLLASRGATDNNDEDAWYSMPLSDIDFTQSRRCTPSYRALPPTYPKLPCSERTALCRSVLNDTWVSVPTGSEDFSFKSMRKNVYEEALFKCEDDRYEFDMVIDANVSTIRALESLLSEIQAEHSQQPFRYQLDRRALSVIHLKAICRVYGSRGNEILELLGKAPAMAIPVILVRLKQKDEEWRRQRIELNKEWKEILERNYLKSLDHRSFYFKQNEKKALLQKTLLGEIKDAPDRKMLLDFGDAFAHRNASSLIALWAEKNLMRSDAEKLVGTLDRFVTGFKAWRPRPGAPVTTAAPKMATGTKVFTRYGPGTVQASSANDCTVRLDKETTIQAAINDVIVEDPPPDVWEFNICVGLPGYTFLRIYHVLCQRLAQAEALCQTITREPTKTTIKHVVEREAGDADKDVNSSGERFSSLMESIRALLTGQLDANKFEEDCCALLGSGSFFIFTVDKLVGMCARAVQSLVQDDKAVKVNELLLAYKQTKTANNAAALYRAQSDALATGSAACVQVRLLSGVKAVAKPSSPDEPLWESPPRLELSFLDAMPYTSKAPLGFAPSRSTSPTPEVTEMGEIDVCIPWRVKVKPLDAAAESSTTRKAVRLEEKSADVVVVTAVYVLERLPGSDDVFRRLAQHDDRESPWWRVESAAKDQMEVDEQEDEDDDSGDKESKEA